MAGSSGDQGYMIISTDTSDEILTNNYYVENYYGSGGTLDYSRQSDGHSKILGMSYDGYPIYGPWGYNSSGTAVRQVSSHRLRTTAELPGARPAVNTTGTTTYTVTVSNGEFLFGGSRRNFLSLGRGKTFIFNQDDASNNGEFLLFSETA